MTGADETKSEVSEIIQKQTEKKDILTEIHEANQLTTVAAVQNIKAIGRSTGT